MIELMQEFVISKTHPSIFYELNNFMVEAISLGVPVVMVDMPEVLYRMKIANDYTLKELEGMFNTIANRIQDSNVNENPILAAYQLFPEVFCKPRDEYMYIMMNEVLNDPETQEDIGQITPDQESIVAYLGKNHVAPISRLWSTVNLTSEFRQ